MSDKKAAKKKTVSLLDTIMEVANRRGFLNPTAEIYGSRIAGFYDFGPLGFLLKANVMNWWRELLVKKAVEPPIYEISGSILLPEDVLIASGHAKSFNDPITNCTNKDCGAVLRADHLIEEKLGHSVESLSIEQMNKIIIDEKIVCSECGKPVEPIQTFNLMLKTNVGPLKNARLAYLRPETAQTIFMNYRNVVTSMRAKLPFGIAQIGSSYRNEISPRQGLIRMREFSQMEIETFVDPKDLMNHPSIGEVRDVKISFITKRSQVEALEKNGPEAESFESNIGKLLDSGEIINPYLAYYMGKEELFYEGLGVPFEHIRFRHMTPQETPFYSMGNYDVEVKLSIGWKEVIGNAYRTDHDISVHMEHSKTNMEYTRDDGTKVIPHNIEPSFGVERAFYCTMEHAFREEKFDREWAWFKFPAKIAPYQVHIYPLMKKEELAKPAMELYWKVKKAGLSALYDKNGQIGKRYARADEIGTPYCVTVDYDTIDPAKTPSSVTIRDRDTMKQIRVKADEVVSKIMQLVNGEIKFEEAGALIDTRKKEEDKK